MPPPPLRYHCGHLPQPPTFPSLGTASSGALPPHHTREGSHAPHSAEPPVTAETTPWSLLKPSGGDPNPTITLQTSFCSTIKLSLILQTAWVLAKHSGHEAKSKRCWQDGVATFSCNPLASSQKQSGTTPCLNLASCNRYCTHTSRGTVHPYLHAHTRTHQTVTCNLPRTPSEHTNNEPPP